MSKICSGLIVWPLEDASTSKEDVRTCKSKSKIDQYLNCCLSLFHDVNTTSSTELVKLRVEPENS